MTTIIKRAICAQTGSHVGNLSAVTCAADGLSQYQNDVFAVGMSRSATSPPAIATACGRASVSTGELQIHTVVNIWKFRFN